MKSLIVLIVALFSVNFVFSQEKEDPLDMSKQLEDVKEFGIPTVKSVDELGLKASELYANQSWDEAISAYEEFAKKANYLANLIASGLEPYYSASYDDRKAVTGLRKLIPFETKANFYRGKRNTAYVRIGLCYSKLDKKDDAVPYLIKALDLISIDEKEEWELARKELYEIIGYQQ